MTLYENNSCVFSERATLVLAPVPRQTEGLTCNKVWGKKNKITIINTLIILSRRTLCVVLIYLAITPLTLTISPCRGPPPPPKKHQTEAPTCSRRLLRCSLKLWDVSPPPLAPLPPPTAAVALLLLLLLLLQPL